MKRFFTLVVLLVSLNCFAQLDTTHFVTTWNTALPGMLNDSAIRIPIQSGSFMNSYNYDVDWNNDGVFDTLGVTGSATHQYSSPGIYTVRIRGSFPAINFDNSFNREKITSIDQWGTGLWESMFSAFKGCKNLTYTAVDFPRFINFIDCTSMFEGATVFDGNLSNWDVSTVISMDYMFFNASSFNGDITTWDVSNVNSMSNMFGFGLNFNQDIGNWDVSNVKNMSRMFESCSNFNQDIGNWNVSSVTTMASMFEFTDVFVGDSLSKWNVSSVINMQGMFLNSYNFNGDIGSWNVSSVTDMSSMFSSAYNFNQDISNWNVSAVTNMSNMFWAAEDFNQNLGDWDISLVTNMTNMLSVFPNFGLSKANYDSTLIGWQQNAHQMNVHLGAVGLEYCLADSARNLLLADGWVISGDIKKCQAVGLNSVEKVERKISFYPNPSSGLININSNIESTYIKIYDLAGKLYFEKSLTDKRLFINFLPNGLYFVDIDGEKQKLILER